MSQLGVFVLDTSRGVPAEGVAVTLSTIGADAHETTIARGLTGSDGCIAGFLADDYLLPKGTYRLTYATQEYFARSGIMTTFPSITVDISISDEQRYVVPLTLTPHGYSFYRGS